MIKHCPFCDHDKVVYIATALSTNKHLVNVECEKCGAGGPDGIGTTVMAAKESAIRGWDDRYAVYEWEKRRRDETALF